MFGFSRRNKQEEILNIERGSIFSINCKELNKDINSKRSIFSDIPEEVIDFNEVIIIDDNNYSSFVHVLPIRRANKLVCYDYTSIDDIRTIHKIYLKEKIGKVFETTLDKFNDYYKCGNHKTIQIYYQ